MPAQKPSHSSLLEHAPEHLKLIGLVSANWALLEGNLCRLLCFMLRIDWPAARAILYTINSNRLRRDIIRNVAISQNYSEDSIAQLNEALAKVQDCANRRNTCVHHSYGIGAKGVIQHRVHAKKNADTPHAVTAQELEDLAVDITKATEALNVLTAVFHPQCIAKPPPF